MKKFFIGLGILAVILFHVAFLGSANAWREGMPYLVLIIDGAAIAFYLFYKRRSDKIKRLYEALAKEKKLQCSFSKGDLPGLIAFPRIEGEYKGLYTLLCALNRGKSSRWITIQGQRTMIESIDYGTVLQFVLPKGATPAERLLFYDKLRKSGEEIKGKSVAEGLRGSWSFNTDSIRYEYRYQLTSEREMKEFSTAYDLIASYR